MMKIIWYNPVQQVYQFGSAEELSNEMLNSPSRSFEVLMKFEGNSQSSASQVTSQLNALNKRLH